MTDPPLPPEVLDELVSTLAEAAAFVGVDRVALEQLLLDARIAALAEGSRPTDEITGGPLLVRRGALLVRDAAGRTIDLIGPGEFHAPAPGERLEPIADSLLVLLPEAAVDLAWSATHAILSAGLDRTRPPSGDVTDVRVDDVMTRGLVTARADEPCRVVAARMRAHRISSVIVEGDGRAGIVTDRDLRNRLVAAGRSADLPVERLTTWPVVSVDVTLTAGEVLEQMLALGIHHLAVADGGELVGMITASDLLQLRLASPLYVRKAIDRSDTVDALAGAVADLPAAVDTILRTGASGSRTARMIATVLDGLTRRLLDLAVDELGPAPGSFAWLAFGSLARREATLASDQDTGILHARLPDDGWFARLGTWTTDALAACGVPRCPGGVMADAGDWRGDAATWSRRIGRWMGQPDSAGLLGAEIGFDRRVVAVHGRIDVEQALRPAVAAVERHHIFLGRLAREATRHRPPLGFLGGITVDRSGDRAGTFDLKRGALLPITDIARLHTLARAGTEVATAERLDVAVAAGQLSRDLASTLTAGYDIALRLRLEHQLACLGADLSPDDRLRPDELEPMTRSELKETFKAIRTAQEALEARYLTSRIG